MSEVIIKAQDSAAVPVHALAEAETQGFLDGGPPFLKAFAQLAEFKGKAGQVLVVPTAEGGADQVLFGLGAALDPMVFRALAAKLPAGTYRVARAPEGLPADQIALAFALGSYKFDRYKSHGGDRARATR
jgi:leucyl aminopeptidase